MDDSVRIRVTVTLNAEIDFPTTPDSGEAFDALEASLGDAFTDAGIELKGGERVIVEPDSVMFMIQDVEERHAE